MNKEKTMTPIRLKNLIFLCIICLAAAGCTASLSGTLFQQTRNNQLAEFKASIDQNQGDIFKNSDTLYQNLFWAVTEAVATDNTPFLAYLLEKGLSPDFVYRKNYEYRGAKCIKGIPLISAALFGHVKTAALFLDKGADTQMRGCDRETALIMACESYIGETRIKELTHLGHYKKYSREQLMTNKLRIARMLIDKGARINQADDKNRTALSVAVDRHFYDMVVMLAKNGAWLSTRPGIPSVLGIAAGKKDAKMVNLLLSLNADVNDSADGKTSDALMIAASGKDKKMTDLLMEKGARVMSFSENIMLLDQAVAARFILDRFEDRLSGEQKAYYIRILNQTLEKAVPLYQNLSRYGYLQSVYITASVDILSESLMEERFFRNLEDYPGRYRVAKIRYLHKDHRRILKQEDIALIAAFYKKRLDKILQMKKEVDSNPKYRL